MKPQSKVRTKFKYLLWFIFSIDLIFAIVLVNSLPFGTPGESTGFIISVIALYFIPFGIFVLLTHLVIKFIRRRELKQQSNTELFPVKLVLNLTPLIAFYGAIHILFFALPHAISEGSYMGYNGISMALGLSLGGARSIHKIREYNTQNIK